MKRMCSKEFCVGPIEFWFWLSGQANPLAPFYVQIVVNFRLYLWLKLTQPLQIKGENVGSIPEVGIA